MAREAIKRRRYESELGGWLKLLGDLLPCQHKRVHLQYQKERWVLYEILISHKISNFSDLILIAI